METKLRNQLAVTLMSRTFSIRYTTFPSSLLCEC
jgi:hypothetical protein